VRGRDESRPYIILDDFSPRLKANILDYPRRKTGVMKRESAEETKQRARAIAARLARAYPDLRVPLAHRNNFELLVAVILSAQCTDEMVNRVTPELFRLFPAPNAMARAPLAQIEKSIRRVGLFHAKALALKKCAGQLVEQHAGEVPATMEELTRLVGVGRKTANVILGHAFGIPGIIVVRQAHHSEGTRTVDTHCKRVSRRLGLTRREDPNKIEQDLMKLLPPEEWTGFSHRLILHGRRICHARKPNCQICVLNDLCPSAFLDSFKILQDRIEEP
jgi:endonuclease-3